MQTETSGTFAIALASIIGFGAFSATAANADSRTGFNVGITLNSDVRDHRATEGNVRDHRTPSGNVYVRDHRSPKRDNTVVVVAPQYRYTCASGTVKLRKMGYSSIAIYDCSATVYQYTAMDGASIFLAKMNARSGQMTVKFVGIAN